MLIDLLKSISTWAKNSSEQRTQNRSTNASEKRTADAMAEIVMIAAVKERERGLVVTLSGSVLFRSAQSTLLPSAQVTLDQVSKALLAVCALNLIVEGHTDSRGSEIRSQKKPTNRSHFYEKEKFIYPLKRMKSYVASMESNP